MNDQNLSIDALNTLIQAVNTYQNDLLTNKQILMNAANVCDQAMGSDAIAQKHISRLNSALEELQKTSQLAADVAQALIADKQRALDTLND